MQSVVVDLNDYCAAMLETTWMCLDLDGALVFTTLLLMGGLQCNPARKRHDSFDVVFFKEYQVHALT
jgi:hypothetical protein